MGKRWVVLLVIVLFVSACADPKMQEKYYNVELSRTQAIIDSITAQSANQQANLAMSMTAYSSSITSAALTPSPGDDIAIAMAWGFMLGRPQQIQVPTLPPLAKPETNSDMIRAWTPLIGMALPFLYPLVWNSSGGGGGSGTKISADNGSKVILDSGNPGSYNKVGGDYSLTNTQSDYSLIRDGDNCADCGPGEGEDPPEDFVCADYPEVGKQCENCSCKSFQAGVCDCIDVNPL